MPNITDAHVLRVKTLVKQGDVKKARTLLKTFDGPRAAKILAQLNSRYPDPSVPISAQKTKHSKASITQQALVSNTLLKEKPKNEPAPPKEKSSSSGCLWIFLALIACAVLWTLVNPAKPKPFAPSVFESVRQTCEWNYDASSIYMSDTTYTNACIKEANWFVEHYPNGAQACHLSSASPEDFLDCMIERDMDYSGEFIAEHKPPPPPTIGPSSGYPDNCAEAKAMGLSEYQAGAYSHLDRDNDGKACYGD